MRTLSARERKLVLVFIVLATAGFVWLAIVSPIVAGFSERASQREILIRQYQANQRIIGSIPRLRRQAELSREALRDFSIAARNRDAAVVAIQDRVQSAIDQIGGEMRSVDDASDDTGPIRVRASTRLTLAQMTTLLMRLQNSPPFLIVESVQVSADQAAISGRLDVMEVNVEVSIPFIAAQSR